MFLKDLSSEWMKNKETLAKNQQVGYIFYTLGGFQVSLGAS